MKLAIVGVPLISLANYATYRLFKNFIEKESRLAYSVFLAFANFYLMGAFAAIVVIFDGLKIEASGHEMVCKAIFGMPVIGLFNYLLYRFFKRIAF